MSFPLIQHISEFLTLPPEHSCFDCWFLFAFLPALLPFFGLFFHLLLLLFWVICWHNSALALVVIMGDCCCVQVQRRIFFVLDMWTPKLPSILFLRSQVFSVRMFGWCEVACTELFQWAPAGVNGDEGHAVDSFFLFSARISLLWSDLCSPPQASPGESWHRSFERFLYVSGCPRHITTAWRSAATAGYLYPLVGVVGRGTFVYPMLRHV